MVSKSISVPTLSSTGPADVLLRSTGMGATGASFKSAGASVIKRNASEGSLLSPPLEQRIDSTWAIGGKKARLLEKRPYTHALSQFFQRPFDTAYEKIAQERNLRKLESLFYEADEDGSGTMDLDEFTKSLCNDNIRDAFARLGIQPHQSDLVFRTLDVKRKGELSIQEFMDGLYGVVGTLDFKAQAKELDIEMLRPGNAKRETAKTFEKSVPTPVQRTSSKSALPSIYSLSGPGSQQQLHRAFVHSALAQALHPATAKKK